MTSKDSFNQKSFYFIMLQISKVVAPFPSVCITAAEPALEDRLNDLTEPALKDSLSDLTESSSKRGAE